MSSRVLYRLAADAVLVVHAGFIAFVLFGLALILVGIGRRWLWVRGFRFRLAHLAAIALVAAEAWLGRLCPLTTWESRLREAAGGCGYGASFVQHWLGRIIFYDLPPEAFAAAYTLFGALVLAVWWLAPPAYPRSQSKPTA